MERLTRRSLLRASAGLAAAGMMARPYLANAAATTATVWWVQGFAQEEDIAFKQMVADYQKASGNRIEYSIVPFAAGRRAAGQSRSCQQADRSHAGGGQPDRCAVDP